MCTIIAGGDEALSRKPFFVTAANPIPPLQIPELSLQKILLMAEKRLPLIYNPIPIFGATGPIDIFGTLVLLVANNLAELVLSQQKSRGNCNEEQEARVTQNVTEFLAGDDQQPADGHNTSQSPEAALPLLFQRQGF